MSIGSLIGQQRRESIALPSLLVSAGYSPVVSRRGGTAPTRPGSPTPLCAGVPVPPFLVGALGGLGVGERLSFRGPPRPHGDDAPALSRYLDIPLELGRASGAIDEFRRLLRGL